jgi:D-sorbitol dehydrogenase (acceptor)
MKLRDKVAMVTGGARGIGAAIARRYGAEGALVMIADVNEDGAQRAAAEIEAAGGRAFACGFDVTRQADLDRLLQTVAERAGGLDILVNNAGVFDMGPLLEISRERWDRLFEVNAKGLFFTLQAAARQMIEQGHGGKIINLASQAGRFGVAMVLPYCATKAAVISITQSAALELIGHGINVNAIAPGVVDTEMWTLVDQLYARYQHLPVGEKKRQVGAAVPYGRMGVPEDLAGAAVFLASADADYVVGQTLNVDGGNRLN